MKSKRQKKREERGKLLAALIGRLLGWELIGERKEKRVKDRRKE